MTHSLRASSLANRVTTFVVVALVPLLTVSAAWGQEKPESKPVTKGGLSLAVSFDKARYCAGEPVNLSFVLKNVGDAAIFIGDGHLAPEYHEAGPRRHFEVHLTADADKLLYFWSGTMTEGTGSGIRKVFRLEPGETYKGTICIFRPFQERQRAISRGQLRRQDHQATSRIRQRRAKVFRCFAVSGESKIAWRLETACGLHGRTPLEGCPGF